MSRFSKILRHATCAAMVGSLLVLAGCHSGSTKSQIAAVQAQAHFDTTIKAYKDGQFLVNGAVLSALDAGSHFAYLKDTGKLPKTVLLIPSDDSKIRKLHLQYLARMQLNYGFTAYYDDKGTLKRINPVQIKARALEDYHAPAKIDDEQKGKSAAGNSLEDRANQQSNQQPGY